MFTITSHSSVLWKPVDSDQTFFFPANASPAKLVDVSEHQGGVPIDAVVTTKTGVKSFLLPVMMLDVLTL